MSALLDRNRSCQWLRIMGDMMDCCPGDGHAAEALLREIRRRLIGAADPQAIDLLARVSNEGPSAWRERVAAEPATLKQLGLLLAAGEVCRSDVESAEESLGELIGAMLVDTGHR